MGVGAPVSHGATFRAESNADTKPWSSHSQDDVSGREPKD